MAEEKTFSAKQVATRIGTDAKQLRKFFRDPASGYAAVGQGGRYDFAETELIQIKTAFDAWNATKVRRTRKPAPTVPTVPRTRTATEKTKEPRPMSPIARAKAGLHGCALDDDPIEFRTTHSVRERVKHHNLGQHPSGQFFPRQSEGGDTMTKRYPPKDSIPGLTKPYIPYEAIEDPDNPGVELELEDEDIPGTGEEEGWDNPYPGPHGETQGIVDAMEAHDEYYEPEFNDD